MERRGRAASVPNGILFIEGPHVIGGSSQADWSLQPFKSCAACYPSQCVLPFSRRAEAEEARAQARAGAGEARAEARAEARTEAEKANASKQAS